MTPQTPQSAHGFVHVAPPLTSTTDQKAPREPGSLWRVSPSTIRPASFLKALPMVVEFSLDPSLRGSNATRATRKSSSVSASLIASATLRPLSAERSPPGVEQAP